MGDAAGSFDKLRMNGGAYQDEWGARRGWGLGAVGRWKFWRGVVRLILLDSDRLGRLLDGFDGFGD